MVEGRRQGFRNRQTLPKRHFGRLAGEVEFGCRFERPDAIALQAGSKSAFLELPEVPESPELLCAFEILNKSFG